jgi:uncharacterized C2H2 Zn-finger protein
MKCFECLTVVKVEDIKYHTQDGGKIFCGPKCSLDFHQRKNNEKTNNNIEDFNNTNSNSTTGSSS